MGDETINWENWVDSYYFWDLYPKGHSFHDRGYGDCLYNAAMLVTAYGLRIRNGEKGLDIKYLKIKWNFYTGLRLRLNIRPIFTFIRDERIDTPMSEDQIKNLIYPMKEVGYTNDECEEIIEKYKEAPSWLRAHQWLHYKRQMNIKVPYLKRLWCDGVECLDSFFDWFSDSESSQSHNIARHEIGKSFYPTFMLHIAIFVFELRLNRFEVLKTYYTRKWLLLQCPIYKAWAPLVWKKRKWYQKS